MSKLHPIRKKFKRISDWLAARLSRGSQRAHLIRFGLLAAAITLPFVFTGYATDDYYFHMIFQDVPGMDEISIPPQKMFSFILSDEEQRRALMDRGLRPWWTPDDAQIELWRPLTAYTHIFDHWAFSGKAWPAHLHSTLWYVLVVVAASLLYYRLIPVFWVAGLASLMFLLDESHSLPAGWLSNRNALLGGFFGIVTLLGHDAWRRDGNAAGLAAALASLSVGLLSGEAVVGVGAYLFAYAVFIDHGPLLVRVGRLTPYLIVVIPWRLIYRDLGYGVVGSGVYLDPLSDPVSFFRDLPRNVILLVQNQMSPPDSGYAWFIPRPYEYGYVFVSFLFVLFFAWVLWPLLKSNSRARFWATGMVLSTVPVSAVFAQDRLLFFPSIGGIALIALFLAGWRDKAYWLSERMRWRKAARFMAYYWSLTHFVLAPILFVSVVWLMTNVDRGTMDLSRSAPMHPEVTEESVVILNTLHDNMVIGFPIVRSAVGDPVPKYTRILSTGPDEITVTRTDAQTIVLENPKGFFPRTYGEQYRNFRTHPFRIGDRVELTGMTVEILEVKPNGHPTRIQFVFDRNLDDPTLHFVTWSLENGYIPVDLPDPGHSIAVSGMNYLEALQTFFGGG